MYLKIVIITFKILKTSVKKVENFFESENLNFDDDLLNVEEIVKE